MKTFTLKRTFDTSGVSGIGIILEGVFFSNGTIAVSWLTEPFSIGIYNSLEDFLSIHVTSHPHNGSLIHFSDGTVLQQNEDGSVEENLL